MAERYGCANHPPYRSPRVLCPYAWNSEKPLQGLKHPRECNPIQCVHRNNIKKIGFFNPSLDQQPQRRGGSLLLPPGGCGQGLGRTGGACSECCCTEGGNAAGGESSRTTCREGSPAPLGSPPCSQPTPYRGMPPQRHEVRKRTMIKGKKRA